MIRTVVMCHAARPCVTTKGVGGTTWVRKAACDCYIQEEHSGAKLGGPAPSS